MLPLHTPETVFSYRHLPSWLLLALAAGAVNAIAFLACSRFVTHVTGSFSHIGMVGMAFDYVVVLGSFVAGAMMSSALLNGRFHKGKKPLHAAPLFITAGIIAFVGVLGLSGAFGEFGGKVEGPHDVAFLSLLAFSMGLQNASVSTSTGALVRTTHMTGPATDLGVHLAAILFSTGETRQVAVRHVVLRAGKIVAFIAGGVIGATLAMHMAYAALFVPALLITGATAISFVNVPVPAPARKVAPS